MGVTHIDPEPEGPGFRSPLIRYATLLDLLDLPEPRHTGCDMEMMTVLTWAVGRLIQVVKT